MSRIGKKPVELKGVKVKMDGQILSFEGPKGKLSLSIPEQVVVEILEDFIQVNQGSGNDKQLKAYHGLYRALIQNIVTGVSNGYEKKLKLIGVGFRAKIDGKNLTLSLGFSHPVVFPIPEGVSVKVEEKDTLITLNAIDKQLIGQTAATIRSFYPPEPYKGKGIRYVDEYVRRKKGKRVA